LSAKPAELVKNLAALAAKQHLFRAITSAHISLTGTAADF
jgi:hypothetical protein